MTPSELRRICESLDDERGTGGQTRLARLLKWSDRKVRRKLAGEPISFSDEMAIRHVLECDGSGSGRSKTSRTAAPARAE
jgi:hypothetical protein